MRSARRRQNRAAITPENRLHVLRGAFGMEDEVAPSWTRGEAFFNAHFESFLKRGFDPEEIRRYMKVVHAKGPMPKVVAEADRWCLLRDGTQIAVYSKGLKPLILRRHVEMDGTWDGFDAIRVRRVVGDDMQTYRYCKKQFINREGKPLGPHVLAKRGFSVIPAGQRHFMEMQDLRLFAHTERRVRHAGLSPL